MRATSVSASAVHAGPALRFTTSKPSRARVAIFPPPDEHAAARERALSRFATELSPASGPEFFALLVEYVAECLGFDAVTVAELPPGDVEHMRPIASYPSSAGDGAVMSALIGSHCEELLDAGFARIGELADDRFVDLPITSGEGHTVGVICGVGHHPKIDSATTALLFRIVADRAAAELERQRAQRELERRDALFIGMIAETHDLVAVIDPDGAFSAMSPSIERVLGYPAASCTTLTVTDLVHPLDRESVEALLRISGTHGYCIEARLRTLAGEWLTMDVSVAEHHDSDGRAFKVMSARDLTDRRRLEDRLRQSQKTEMIGRLATGIAHDFGNILMVVGSHADVMRLRTTADDPRHSYVDAIQAAVSRGADLARQLMAFTRHREFELKRVDLTASIEQSAALLRRLVGSSIRLETRLSPDARYVAADATQIEQVLLNLTLNARDSMPNGGEITFVTTPAAVAGSLPPVVAQSPAEFVCCSVIDTGCGMSEYVQAHIFEPMFTTKTDGTGTGIGLATVHDIIARHGGFIDVFSAEGVGTTFRIFLRRTMTPQPRA
jgi:PAS domain S-box-containing protein